MRLRLTPRAGADLEEISAYLEPRSPQGAQRVEAALHEAFALLLRCPEIGHQRGRNVRRFALPRYPYLIFYSVDEEADEVRVFTIRHAARKPEN